MMYFATLLNLLINSKFLMDFLGSSIYKTMISARQSLYLPFLSECLLLYFLAILTSLDTQTQS